MAYAKEKRKKKLGSYPYLTVVFSITLALFTLGIFGLILIYGNALSESIKSNHQIQVFLNDNLSTAQTEHLKNILSTKEYAQEVIYTSKQEAKNKYISNNNENPEDLLGYNPLKWYFTIILKSDFSDKNKLPLIKSELEKMKGVYEVEYLKDFINVINENLQKIGVIILFICLILTIIVFILINNTIKLALFSQRFIIRSMQLVGATSWFIQKPFLWRASWQGLLSAWISCTILFSLTQYAKEKIENLSLIENIEHIFILFGILLVTGMIIGFLSSFIAVRKYLKLSLDELY